MRADDLIATLATTTREIEGSDRERIPLGTSGLATVSGDRSMTSVTFCISAASDPHDGHWAWETVPTDAVELRVLGLDEILTTYLHYLRTREWSAWWANEIVHDLMADYGHENAARAEVVWDVLLRLLTLADDDRTLCDIGVALLEHLVDNMGEQFIERIEVEAVNNSRFRTALGCVWAADSPIRPRVDALLHRHPEES